MPITPTTSPPKPVDVGMGRIELIEAGQLAKSVLGSCIGLALYHPKSHLTVVAHIVLPDSRGNPSACPGKFADTGIPEMLRLLAKQGVSKSGLQAKMAGGSNMFKSSGKMQVGRSNCETVKTMLANLKIPIAGEHVGGTKGRRIVINSDTKEIEVQIAGETAITL